MRFQSSSGRCAVALLGLASTTHAWELVREYSGPTFFDRWDFYGSWDNLTLSNVTWVDEPTAQSAQLAYVQPNGHAIMKVDNTTDLAWGGIRNSIRITSQDTFDIGSVWVLDLVHLPFGCSVWPAFWAKGPVWPDNGEIDIVEGINLMQSNQMAVHTTTGCIHDANVTQTGTNTFTDCSKNTGCAVLENKPNSFGEGFATAGGGVWATQFDETGIFMWFWSRPDVPPSIATATATSGIDIASWGPPSAAFPVTPRCDLTTFFTPQQLVFDIALCGHWAGVQSIYDTTCKGHNSNGTCYSDIVGPGSPQYDDAYFEVSYLRAYTTALPTSTSVSTAPTQVGAAPTTVSDNSATITPTPTQLTGSGKSGAGSVRLAGGAQVAAAVAAGLVWLVMSS